MFWPSLLQNLPVCLPGNTKFWSICFCRLCSLKLAQIQMSQRLNTMPANNNEISVNHPSPRNLITSNSSAYQFLSISHSLFLCHIVSASFSLFLALVCFFQLSLWLQISFWSPNCLNALSFFCFALWFICLLVHYLFCGFFLACLSFVWLYNCHLVTASFPKVFVKSDNYDFWLVIWQLASQFTTGWQQNKEKQQLNREPYKSSKSIFYVN